MSRAYELVFIIAVPTIFVGLPAIFYVLAEKIKWFWKFVDRIGRDL